MAITGSLARTGRRQPFARKFRVLPLLALLALWAPGARAGLLKVPRVYNALITTDERLLPSRAVSVSAPLLGAPLVLGPTPLASPVLPLAPAIAPPVPGPAPVAARVAPKATEEAKEVPQNASAPAAKEGEIAAPLAPAPALLPLYSPYYSYYPQLLPYSLAPHHLSPLVLFNPFLPHTAAVSAPVAIAAPAAPAALAPPTDPSGRALPVGARDEPEKDAVSVDAN